MNCKYDKLIWNLNKTYFYSQFFLAYKVSQHCITSMIQTVRTCWSCTKAVFISEMVNLEIRSVIFHLTANIQSYFGNFLMRSSFRWKWPTSLRTKTVAYDLDRNWRDVIELCFMEIADPIRIVLHLTLSHIQQICSRRLLKNSDKKPRKISIQNSLIFK